jgi:HTH-type transcriptional regulator/antitoxin HigA
MIGPDFLSTFRLKPIETIGEWENARLWKLDLEAELYRRKRDAEEEGVLQQNVDAVQDSEVHDSAEGLEGNRVSENSTIDREKNLKKDRQRTIPDGLTFDFTLSEVVSLLGVLTDHFDRHFWYNDSSDVIDEIRSRMQRQEFRNCDLVEEIGSKGYVSDILNRRKPLTLRTARVFKEFFDIPAEWLICGYKLDPREVAHVKFGSRSKVGNVARKKTMKKPESKKLPHQRFFR